MPKILIVDDERDVCEVLQETLELEGYQVQSSHTGTDALEKMDAVNFDAMIVDLRLEGKISGIDVIRKAGSQPVCPLILATSGTPKILVETILEKEGIKRYVKNILEKPSDLTPEKVTKAIHTILRERA